MVCLILSLTTAQAESARIYLDGLFTDWETIDPIYSDPIGDQASGTLDFGRLWVANDERYLFISIEVGAELLLAEPNAVTLYLDIDNNANTGIPINGIGAELNWVFGNKSGSFRVGSTPYTVYHENLGLITAPTVSAGQFEMVLDRNAHPVGQNPLFPNITIKLLLVDNGPGLDRCPDQGTTVSYSFDESPPPVLPGITLLKQDTTQFRIVSYNVLQDGIFTISKQAAFDRMLSAIAPDIIGFEEIYNHTAIQTRDLIESMLPSQPGENWNAAKVSPDVICVSRFPILSTFNIHDDGNGAFLIDLHPDFDKQLLFIVAHLPAGQENLDRQREVDAIMAFVRDAKEPGGLLTLEENTPIIIVGDMNFVGYSQQLTTLLTGQIIYQGQFGSPFDPDWDGSDFSDLLPRHTNSPLYFTWGNDNSLFWPGRLDLMIYSDYVLQTGSKYVLYTPDMDPDTLTAYGILPTDALTASDHVPIVGDFSWGVTSVTDPEYGDTPDQFKLLGVHPNPFNPTTTIQFELPVAGWVELEVFDLLGSSIGIHQMNWYMAGAQTIHFDGTNLPSGIYFYRLKAGKSQVVGKMALLK